MSEDMRRRIYILHHIPHRYFIPNAQGLAELITEMNNYGNIYLDAYGQPACLSGKPTAITRPEHKE